MNLFVRLEIGVFPAFIETDEALEQNCFQKTWKIPTFANKCERGYRIPMFGRKSERGYKYPRSGGTVNAGIIPT